MELNIYIENISVNFSKAHKYQIGSELREKAREILYSIYKIYFSEDKKRDIMRLRDTIEEMKIILLLAKELKVLGSFKKFEISSKLTYELAKQAQGWIRSLR